MEQFGLFSVERYVCEGLPHGTRAFFDFRGEAACLDYIKIRGGIVTLHGSTGSWVKVKTQGDSKTSLYLAATDISGSPMTSVVAQSRRAPKITACVNPQLFPLQCEVCGWKH